MIYIYTKSFFLNLIIVLTLKDLSMFSDLVDIRQALQVYFQHPVIDLPQVVAEQEDHDSIAPPIEMEDCSQLSPRNVSADTQVDNYFICKICLKIVSQPRECTKCETAFCKGCLDQWNRNAPFLKCPLRCDQPKFKPIHRFA